MIIRKPFDKKILKVLLKKYQIQVIQSKNTNYNTKITETKNSIPDIVGLVTKNNFNSNITELKKNT